MSRRIWWGLAAALGAGFVGGVRAEAAPDTLDGVWRSHGYGLIAEVRDGRTTIYDFNRMSCSRAGDAPGITDRLFAGASLTDGGRRLVTKAPWGLTRLYFDRLSVLPELCSAPAPNPHDPVYNFEVLWNDFNDYYAFFKERGVDWAALRDEYRPKVTAATTDAELIEIIRAMFRQLQDRHVTLSVGTLRVNAGFTEIFTGWYEEFARHPVGDRGDFLRRQIVTYLSPSWDHYLDRRSVQHVSDAVTTGSALDGQVGYAMIGAESGFAATPYLEGDKQAGIDQLDGVFSRFKGKRGLIIDMRINYGGHDDVALALAGLMTPRDRAGFSKCTRDGDGWTPVQHTEIHTRPNAFTGPIVLLISSMNWSSGENVAMMVKDLPNVVVVGDHTASVHSDVLTKYLPNGWRLTLSNEAFEAPDGTMYEAVGVPPDILVPYDPETVRATGVDPAMEKAVHLLASPDFNRLAAGVKRGRPLGRPFPCR